MSYSSTVCGTVVTVFTISHPVGHVASWIRGVGADIQDKLLQRAQVNHRLGLQCVYALLQPHRCELLISATTRFYICSPRGRRVPGGGEVSSVRVTKGVRVGRCLENQSQVASFRSGGTVRSTTVRFW